GQPYSFGLASEPVLEVADTPENLRLLIPSRRQRKDGVVIGLRQGGPVAGEMFLAFLVRIDDRAVGLRFFFLEPRQKRGTEVETDARVIVRDLQNLRIAVDDPRHSIRRIAFSSNPFIPVVKWIGRILKFNI